MCPFESALTDTPTFNRGEWFSRYDPISSSSKHPTILTIPGDASSDDASRASIAAKQHNLSSILPAKMNSLSSPPS